MEKITLADVLAMPIAERILLVEDIWDSIAAVPDAIPLPDDQREELDRRLDAYHAKPEAGSPWEAVKARIRKQA